MLRALFTALVTAVALAAGLPFVETVSCQAAGCPPVDTAVKSWQPGSTVYYNLDGLNGVAGADVAQVKAAARKAFEDWNAVNAQNNSRVRFVENVASKSQLKFRIGAAISEGVPYAAVTEWAPQTWLTRRSKFLRSATIVLDLNAARLPPPCAAWVPAGECKFFSPAVDGYLDAVRSITAHEIGHTMGLGNIPSGAQAGKSIMNGAHRPNDCFKNAASDPCTKFQPLGPTADCDRTSVNTRYPTPPGGTGGSGGSSSGSVGGSGSCSIDFPDLDGCYEVCTGQRSYYTDSGCGTYRGDLCGALYPEVFPNGDIVCEVTTRVRLLDSGAMTQIRTFSSGHSISLQTVNGSYLTAYGGGGSTVGATSGSVGSWESLQLVDLDGGDLMDGDAVALATATGHYLQAYGGGGSILQATAPAIGSWETFTVIDLDHYGDEVGAGDRIALRTTNGHYVVAEGGGGGDVNANRGAIGSWETFTLRTGNPGGSTPGPGPGPGGGSEADVLLPGEALNPDQGRTSSNGQYRLVYQGDGNLVLYQGGTPLWASNTAGTAAGQAVMQHDGNFVVYNAYGTPLRHSGTWWSPGAYLLVQNDGNVVVYSAGGTPLWDRYGAGW